jgi:hypothetical protein
VLSTDGIPNFLFVERLPPGLLTTDYISAMTFAHFGDSVAEKAVRKYKEFRAGIDKVADRGLHAGAAGAGDGKREIILRSEGGAQPCAYFLDNGEKVRVEVAYYGLSHGFVHTRFDHGGTWPVEKAFRWIDHKGIPILWGEVFADLT